MQLLWRSLCILARGGYAPNDVVSMCFRLTCNRFSARRYTAAREAGVACLGFVVGATLALAAASTSTERPLLTSAQFGDWLRLLEAFSDAAASPALRIAALRALLAGGALLGVEGTAALDDDEARARAWLVVLVRVAVCVLKQKTLIYFFRSQRLLQDNDDDVRHLCSELVRRVSRQSICALALAQCVDAPLARAADGGRTRRRRRRDAALCARRLSAAHL